MYSASCRVRKLHLAGDLPATFGANYFHFGNIASLLNSPESNIFLRCLLIAGTPTPKSSANPFLGQPDGFLFKENIHLHRPVERGVEKELVWGAHGLASYGYVRLALFLRNQPAERLVVAVPGHVLFSLL